MTPPVSCEAHPPRSAPPTQQPPVILVSESKVSSRSPEQDINRGFVCSPPVIEALLNCIRESLVECSTLFYKQRGVLNVEANSSDELIQKQINM